MASAQQGGNLDSPPIVIPPEYQYNKQARKIFEIIEHVKRNDPPPEIPDLNPPRSSREKAAVKANEVSGAKWAMWFFLAMMIYAIVADFEDPRWYWLPLSAMFLLFIIVCWIWKIRDNREAQRLQRPLPLYRASTEFREIRLMSGAVVAFTLAWEIPGKWWPEFFPAERRPIFTTECLHEKALADIAASIRQVLNFALQRLDSPENTGAYIEALVPWAVADVLEESKIPYFRFELASFSLADRTNDSPSDRIWL